MGDDHSPDDDSSSNQGDNPAESQRSNDGDDSTDSEVERAWEKVATEDNTVDDQDDSSDPEPSADDRDDSRQTTTTDQEGTEQTDNDEDSVTTESAASADSEPQADRTEASEQRATDRSGEGTDTTEAKHPPREADSIDDPAKTTDDHIDSLESRVEELEQELKKTESQLKGTEQQLTEKEAELTETQEELETVKEEFAAFRSVEPRLEEFQQSSVSAHDYIDALEEYVENLNEEMERKDSVIQELKDTRDDAAAEARGDAIEAVTTRFFNQVRESLVRGIEQSSESMPKGVQLTLDQFDEVLAEYNTSVVAPTVGEQLGGDEMAREHVEVTQVDYAERYEADAVMDVEERGLKRDGDIIKKPRVKLSRGPPLDEETESEDINAGDDNQAEDDGSDEHGPDRPSSGSGENDATGFEQATDDTDESEPGAESEQDGDGFEPDGSVESTPDVSDESNKDNSESGVGPERAHEGTDQNAVQLRIGINDTQLEVGDTIGVSVLDDRSRPVAGAEVSIADTPKAQTDTKGRASVTVMDSGEVTLTVRKPDDEERVYESVSKTLRIESS